MNALILPFRQQHARNHVTLDDLAGQLAAEEGQHNPDLDVAVRTVQMTPAGMLHVPTLGELAMTDWSKGQFSKMLGVTWDRWFMGASPDDRADEVNRRLARAQGSIRLRTTRKIPEGMNAQGTVRAVVSREYATVPDTMLSLMVRDALVGVEEEATIIRSTITDLTTSFVVRLGKPFKPGGPGNVGDVWGGILVRNSGVGYTKLVVSLFLHRLACRNGMVVPLPDADLVRTRHRWIHAGDVRVAIERGLAGIGDRLHRGAEVLGRSAQFQVADVEGEVRGLLREAILPARLLGEVMMAYAREPHASRFGVSQAITLAAQDQNPELRFELERAAGRYLARN